MEDKLAVDISDDIDSIQAAIEWEITRIPSEWGITRQQMQNAMNLLRDAERRLRNGDDVKG